jgi:hypothetical protein
MASGGFVRYGLISEVTGKRRQLSALLVALTFIRAHIAAASVLFVRTRLAALIGLQQISLAIRAATGISGINRRASREQRDSLCRSAVVCQLSELGVGVVQVTCAIEIAGVVAAQVVAI